MVNFGKNYKDDIVNEWEQYYFDYNKLKKITNRTELSNSENINNNIKIHDDEVILELQKVDKFYNEKVNKILEDINSEYVHSNIPKIKQIFEDSDKLRHFILLNTISAVKLIKRRNKRIPNTASVLDFISEKDFYKCIKLKNI